MADASPKSRFSFKRAAAYVAAFTVGFAATLYWSIPYDLLGQRALQVLRAQTGVVVETASLSPYWVLGVRARGVKVDLPAQRPGEKPLHFALSAVTARLEPIASLLGGPKLAFTATAPEGEVSGTVQQQKANAVHLAAEVHSLALGKIPGLWDDLGVGFQGKVNGRVTGTVKAGNPQTLDGLLDLTVAGARFGGGMIHGFTVPSVDLGDLHLTATAEKGVVQIEPPLKVKSKDLDARLSGTIHLRRIAVTSAPNLTLRFRPTNRFWKANSTLASLAQAMLQNARDPSGYYAFRITGVLGQPMVLPQR